MSEVNIRPGVGMLALFPHMKYQPWYALGELVDNAIQSYLANQTALVELDPQFILQIRIDIDRNNGTITVADNAAGIAASDWSRAFRVAQPPRDAGGLSQFGVGMKAACCWFSRDWNVRSSALGETVVREVEFNVPEIILAGSETLAVLEAPASLSDHFTVVTMRELLRTPATKTLGKIRSYLGSIYRDFLRQGDVEILCNGEPVSYDEVAVLEAPRWTEPDGEVRLWRRQIAIELESGRRVWGFVGIRETGVSRQGGIALFYRRKVVQGAGEDAYRPESIFGGWNSFQSQRLFGELHMDDFDVTYTKDSLVWYDEEDEFIDLLKAAIDAEPLPLIRQSREYRKRNPEVDDGDAVASILTAIESAFADSPELAADEGVHRQVGGSEAPASTEDQVTPTDVRREVRFNSSGTEWRVDLRLSSRTSGDPWLSVDYEGTDVLLELNQAHPFLRRFCEIPTQELEPVWRVAIAFGLGEVLARAQGVRMAGLVRSNADRVLTRVLSGSEIK